MRTEFASSPTSNCLPDSLSCAGVGVKQSGNRLFQLNNLKRKIVDELFLDQSSSFPLPVENKTCETSHFRRVRQAESDDVSKLIQMTDM